MGFLDTIQIPTDVRQRISEGDINGEVFKLAYEEIEDAWVDSYLRQPLLDAFLNQNQVTDGSRLAVEAAVRTCLCGKPPCWYCRTRADRAEAERRSKARYISRRLRAQILAQHCCYCGRSAQVIDHIYPVSRGGTNDVANLAPACEACNDEKFDATVDEWREWRISHGLGWPPTQELKE